MLAYEMALLSPRESHEYKWNVSVNHKGGVGQNIPNDNLVEIQVHNIKAELQTQGPNKSFESAQQICKTAQVVDKMSTNLSSACTKGTPSGEHPEVDRKKDIVALANEIVDAGLLGPHHTFATFQRFKDPISRIDSAKLANWMKDQKDTAALHMKRK